MSPTDLCDRMRIRLAAELPLVLRNGVEVPGALAEILGQMAGFLGDRARAIEDVPLRLDPATAREADLPWLAGWFGWGWLFRDPVDPRRGLDMAAGFPSGAERLRTLLLATPALAPLRGQARGLSLTLRIATGLDDVRIEQDLAHQHLAIRIPDLPDPWRPWIARLIAAERPVHLTWALVPPGRGEKEASV